MKSCVLLPVILPTILGLQVRGSSPGTRLAPENLNEQPLQFIVDAQHVGENTRFTVIVQRKGDGVRPVLAVWLNVYEGDKHIVACPVATRPSPSHPRGTAVSFIVAPAYFEKSKLGIEHVVKGAPSHAGYYWFYLKDFADARASKPAATPQAAPGAREKAPLAVLEEFLALLAGGDFRKAYSLVAPSSKENGDPIAYGAPLDYGSFTRELSPPPLSDVPQSEIGSKFREYELGAFRWESESRFRVFVTFGGWDKDEVLIVREAGHWYVADPIHIIR